MALHQLPTRAEWESWQRNRKRPEELGPSARPKRSADARDYPTLVQREAGPAQAAPAPVAHENFERSPARRQPPPPYQPPQQPPPGAQYRPVQATNVLAVVSLAFGILWIYWIGSAIAIITGHLARQQIRDSDGTQGGDALAVVGLALGWIGVGILLIILLAASTVTGA